MKHALIIVGIVGTISLAVMLKEGWPEGWIAVPDEVSPGVIQDDDAVVARSADPAPNRRCCRRPRSCRRSFLRIRTSSR